MENAYKKRIGLVLLSCTLILIIPAAGVYDYNGIPLTNVRHETINGGVYVGGGHGLDYSDYTQTFNVPSGTIRYAKLYVGVWGGNADDTGTIDTTYNSANLGSRSLQGKVDTNPDVYVSGFGVYWVSYDVTGSTISGQNTATVTTGGDIDGRIYGIVLVAVYDNQALPKIEYWINEGNENPNDKTPKNTATTNFDGTIDTGQVSSAKLWTSYIASKTGDADTLSMNGNLIATDAASQDEGTFFDLDEWDVTGALISSGNTVEFNRGSGTSLHPVSTILVISQGSPSGQPDMTVEDFTLPSYIYEDTVSKINARIANTGSGNSASFKAVLYVDGVSTDTRQISGLNAGSNTTVSFSWPTQAVGTYLLEVKADPDDLIPESDETNNENSTTAEVVSKNGYFGDNPMTVYRHDKINGDIVYTIGNSTYKGSLSTDSVYAVESNVTIPTGSSVKLARLYSYWSWSKNVLSNTGVDPEMEVKLDGTIISPDVKYTDRKGFGNYDYPYGTYAYNVTGFVTSTGNYTTVVKNVGTDQSYSMLGIGLLLILEDPSGQEIEYWIAEGADIIYSSDTYGVSPEQATTYVEFDGSVDADNVKNATLITVVPGADKGDLDNNELIFNNENWIGELDAPSSKQQIAIDYREVGNYLQSNKNKVGIRDRGDSMVPSNAILVIKTRPQLPDLGSADITAGMLTEIGIKTTADNLFGAASGTMFFGIYDKFDRIMGKREAPDIAIYGINSSTDPSEWDWSKIKSTGVELDLNLSGPMGHESRVYTTIVSYYDYNTNGMKDEKEERVYKTITQVDGTFVLQMEEGSYDIYASY